MHGENLKLRGNFVKNIWLNKLMSYTKVDAFILRYQIY